MKKFTLIELIIVIVVIGILAGMALPKFIGVERDAKVAAMDQDLDTLEKAVQLYNSDKGEYPLKATKVTISDDGLKQTLSNINDDSSNIYEIDMDKIKPYLEQLKFNDSTTDTYLYSTKTGVAINEQGKIDSNNDIHYILNNDINQNDIIKIPKLSLMISTPCSDSSFLITNTNNLYSWGRNNYGKLGDKTTNNQSTPINITLVSGIKFSKIVSGYGHTVSIGDDGELYTWGQNDYGQLGDGTTITKYTPTKITLANGVKPTQIACGSANSMAIGSDGELYTWGNNYNGELGDGTTANKLMPTKITLSNGVKPKQIICGKNQSMIIGSDGELYTCGSNSYGQLGIGTSDWNSHSTLTKITLAIGVKPTKIACGSLFSMAIGDDDNLYAWGYNDHGELGNGTTTTKTSPTKAIFPNGVNPTQIANGDSHTIAIGSDGELYAWGYDGDGELGNGIWNGKTTPSKIILASGVKPIQIACGIHHSMAIGSDNELYVWGYGEEGQMGNGHSYGEATPTKITYDFK